MQVYLSHSSSPTVFRHKRGIKTLIPREGQRLAELIKTHLHHGFSDHIGWRLLAQSILHCPWHGNYDALGTEVLRPNDKDRDCGGRSHHQHCCRHHKYLHHCQECPAWLRASAHKLWGDTHRNCNLHAAREGADNGSVSWFHHSFPHPIDLPIKTALHTSGTHTAALLTIPCHWQNVSHPLPQTARRLHGQWRLSTRKLVCG